MTTTKTNTEKWNQIIGPFYTEETLTTWLNITPETLKKYVTTNQILQTTTKDGTKTYPTFQFTDEGELLPALDEITEAFTPLTYFGSWELAQWLNTGHNGTNRTYADHLKEKRIEYILTQARRTVNLWSH